MHRGRVMISVQTYFRTVWFVQMMMGERTGRTFGKWVGKVGIYDVNFTSKLFSLFYQMMESFHALSYPPRGSDDEMMAKLWTGNATETERHKSCPSWVVFLFCAVAASCWDHPFSKVVGTAATCTPALPLPACPPRTASPHPFVCLWRLRNPVTGHWIFMNGLF